MIGPVPLLLATGGATKGFELFAGVRASGVGMIPAFLSDARRSDPTFNSGMGLVDAAGIDTEGARVCARDAC